ncbi:glycosyltransferase [Paenibacillus sp. sgz500958]|uniref:glycosyltransferase n=1 Tax=Paenibacillus sp. sgz500958 TaxID=3242475 RepID=UPI0036D30AF3
MEAGPSKVNLKQGVSIITCTNRQSYLRNLFSNYARQRHAKKELVIIVNNDAIPLAPYQRLANKHSNIQIMRLPGHLTLGACLNYAVKKTKYSFIAKFDDDDYYATGYLTDSMRVMSQTGADIVGKRAHYMYLNGKKLLLLRYYNKADQYVSIVQGATLLAKRYVFSRVWFPDQNRGECVKFCSDCLTKGFKIYSGSPYNFLAIRRQNSRGHT